jgi:hypothetical protein
MAQVHQGAPFNCMLVVDIPWHKLILYRGVDGMPTFEFYPNPPPPPPARDPKFMSLDELGYNTKTIDGDQLLPLHLSQESYDAVIQKLQGHRQGPLVIPELQAHWPFRGSVPGGLWLKGPKDFSPVVLMMLSPRLASCSFDVEAGIDDGEMATMVKTPRRR